MSVCVSEYVCVSCATLSHTVGTGTHVGVNWAQCACVAHVFM